MERFSRNGQPASPAKSSVCILFVYSNVCVYSSASAHSEFEQADVISHEALQRPAVWLTASGFNVRPDSCKMVICNLLAFLFISPKFNIVHFILCAPPHHQGHEVGMLMKS